MADDNIIEGQIDENGIVPKTIVKDIHEIIEISSAVTEDDIPAKEKTEI